MVDRFICLPHVSPSRSPGPEYIRSFTVTHSMKLRLALANAIARSESRVHVIVVVAALILPIRDAVTALSFDRQKYSIGWETWAGLIILALTIVGWLVARSYLKSVGTVRIGTLSGTPATLPSGVSIVPVDSAERCRQLAAYADAHYPARYISALSADSRLDMYGRWLVMDPQFARLAIRTKGGRDTVIGCCIILAISPTTFANYRNGFGSPDAWTTNDRPPASGGVALFMSALHCAHTRGLPMSAVLAELFCSFVAVRITAMDTTILVAPVKTPSGRCNVRQMGFEMFRRSKAGFDIWELDARRASELSSAARATIAAIAGRPHRA
jgi:hypothetical protein